MFTQLKNKIREENNGEIPELPLKKPQLYRRAFSRQDSANSITSLDEQEQVFVLILCIQRHIWTIYELTERS